ncbi:MAG: dimethylamine corrinoid protein 3 [Thermoplasmata archaeon]|nr:MAG: dimethylamine corrinoid protein 3 [Thermoplasmata archaeon]
MSEEAILSEIISAIKGFDADAAVEAAKKSLEAGMDPVKVIEEGISKALRDVGDKFERGELFLVHLAAAAEAAMQAIKVLEPELMARKVERKVVGKVVIGTVAGDIHSIGKNLVATLLTAAGFDVYNLGEDVPVETFIQKAKEVGADVIAASALLTATREVQRDLAEAIRREGLDVLYIVGGAAVTSEWAEEIGALYAADASSAVKLLTEKLSGRGG